MPCVWQRFVGEGSGPDSTRTDKLANEVADLQKKLARLEEAVILDKATRPNLRLTPEEAESFVQSQKRLMIRLKEPGLFKGSALNPFFVGGKVRFGAGKF